LPDIGRTQVSLSTAAYLAREEINFWVYLKIGKQLSGSCAKYLNGPSDAF